MLNSNGNLKLKSGTVIKDANIDGLSKEDMLELYDEKMTMYDGLVISRNIHNLSNDFKDMKTLLNDNLEEMKLHSKHCPIKPLEVQKLVDAKNDSMLNSLRDEKSEDGKRFNMRIDGRVKHVIKTSIFSTAAMAKAFTAIIILFGILFGLVKWTQ